MENKVFLDINILVDLIDASRVGHQSAKDLFSLIEKGKVRGYFSESIINTTAYLVKKVVPAILFNKLMKRLSQLIKVLPCTNLIIEQACKQVKNDFEDAVLYQIAIVNKMDFFITSDIKDFKNIEHAVLPVVTAANFLKKI